jgi:hypothetical protein
VPDAIRDLIAGPVRGKLIITNGGAEAAPPEVIVRR